MGDLILRSAICRAIRMPVSGACRLPFRDIPRLIPAQTGKAAASDWDTLRYRGILVVLSDKQQLEEDIAYSVNPQVNLSFMPR